MSIGGGLGIEPPDGGWPPGTPVRMNLALHPRAPLAEGPELILAVRSNLRSLAQGRPVERVTVRLVSPNPLMLMLLAEGFVA